MNTSFHLKCEKAGLPVSQDAIIQLCRQRFPNKTDLTLVSQMRIGIQRHYCNNYLNSQSVADFWILFYMAVERKMSWNESTNNWENGLKSC